LAESNRTANRAIARRKVCRAPSSLAI